MSSRPRRDSGESHYDPGNNSTAARLKTDIDRGGAKNAETIGFGAHGALCAKVRLDVQPRPFGPAAAPDRDGPNPFDKADFALHHTVSIVGLLSKNRPSLTNTH